MKNHQSRFWHWITSTVFLAVVGTVFHFLNDWTENSPLTVWFAPVNESIWEHLKLLFFPGLVLIVRDFWSEHGNPTAQAVGILLGMLWITAAYYTLYGITGRNWDWVNIAIFLIACCISQWIAERNTLVLTSEAAKWISIVLLIVLLYLFIRFTYHPPEWPFFIDPQTGRFGIKR